MKEKTINKLIEKARLAARNSYSPYSNYAVGAALLTQKGNVFLGTNVENASYPAGICAERSAITSAVTAGEKEFKALAIYTSGESVPYPCGICRQVISEFSHDLPIIIAHQDNYKIMNISELLPNNYEFKK